ncbi:MAG: DUF4433 domain-containing protein [Opitutae bacterium]|nr:DUF4433 domain-containing protein [Opitutae bacterium]
MEHGILSYDRASKLKHHSVAMQPVQDRRDVKRVPGGLMLHHYANLYFHARNPMMFARQEQASDLCVLCVSRSIAQLDGVVFADRNASSDWVRFLHPSQADLLDFDAIYAADWRDTDRFRYFEKKSKKCAEVLVPRLVEPRFIAGAAVVDQAAETRLRQLGFALSVRIDPHLFFR